MSAPAEQLLRDYLNRLSVAARGQLGPDDRRALVNRTRNFIEHKTGTDGRPPDAMEVAKLLAGLGDPVRLVSRERQRLAALGEEVPDPSDSRRRVPKALRRDPGRVRGTSWHWPVQEGRPDLQLTLLHGAGATAGDAGTAEADQAGSRPAAGPDSPAPASPAPGGSTPASPKSAASASTSPASASPAPAPRPERGSDPADDSEQSAGPLVPAQPRESDWLSVRPQKTPADANLAPEAAPPRSHGPEPTLSSGDPAPPATPEPEPAAAGAEPAASGPGTAVPPGRPWWPFVVAWGTSEDPGAEQNADPASPASAGNRDPAGTAHLQRPAEPRALQAVQSARRLAARIGSWCRARPLVAVAVGLLGLGGVIYPPVWVLGAILALFLQAWDYRDKWIGLALPIVLTVIGSAFGVAAGGGHGTFGHNVHDGWMFAVIISRITAVLGAGYLAWRTVHQRRPPEIPPWNKPRKVP